MSTRARPTASPSTVSPDYVTEAAAAADRAADRGGVRIRMVSEPAEQAEAAALLAQIWRTDQGGQPVSTELLRAFSHVGNYVAGAFLNGGLVGTLVAFFGEPGDGVLHSHVAGVAPEARGRNVGHALKLHQRAWALRRGVDSITWTFDPLVRRNAYFNIGKLGALPSAYLSDFYGRMLDRVNAGGPSDRFLIDWRLTSDRARHAALGGVAPDTEPPATAVVLLDHDADGHPRPHDVPVGPPWLVMTPSDIELLRADDPEQAAEWRVELRDSMLFALGNGYRVTGMSRTGWYVLTREEAL